MIDEIPKMHQDLRALAGAIKHALNAMYQQASPFLFILVNDVNAGEVRLHTITEIQDANVIRRIGQHLIDMADAQERAASDASQTEVQGHA